MQKPVENYIFEGGTSFAFTRAPVPEEEIEIYFYKGVDGTDSTLFDDIMPTIETGDVVQVISNNIYPNTITQDERTVYNLTFSDKFETNRYTGLGVDETNNKPLSWTKQKTDKKINGQYVYKSRDVLEPLIFPTARIIKDVSTTDTQIFVDNVELFEYEDNRNKEEAPSIPYSDGSTPLDAVIIEDTNPVTALFTASIDGNGSVDEKIIKAGASTDYNSGTILELTAVPENGWAFLKWSGDINFSENPTEILRNMIDFMTCFFIYHKQVILTGTYDQIMYVLQQKGSLSTILILMKTKKSK